MDFIGTNELRFEKLYKRMLLSTDYYNVDNYRVKVNFHKFIK